jgi:hypothetical protein
MPLPITKARLATSLILKSSQGTLNAGTDGASVTQSSSGKVLSSVTSFSRNQTRDVHPRYSLGKFAFMPEFLIPGPIKTELTLRKVALYKGDVIKEFGFEKSGNLLYQVAPLVIDEVQNSPQGTVTILTYLDCWLTSNPIAYDIMGDQLVVQECKVMCGRMQTTEGYSALVNLITQSVKKLITKPVPISQ